MNKSRTIRQWVAVVLMGIAAALVGTSMFTYTLSDNESYATALGKRVEQRLGILEDAIKVAAESEIGHGCVPLRGRHPPELGQPVPHKK